jgi:integrase
VEDWKSSRLKLGRADTTVKREVTALKTALSRAQKWGFAESNPALDVKVKIDSDLRVRYLKPDERKRLLNALEARDEKLRGERAKANEWRRVRGYDELPEITEYADYLHPLVLTVINTGLRRSEALSLTWGNVDLDEHQQATVRAAHSKKRKTRRVQLNSFTVDVLKEWKKQGRGKGHVFPNPANGLRLQRIDTAWRNLMKSAKLENFRFHDLRHDYASQLVMRGVDIYTVKEMMGHSTLDMTERYAHLDPKRLAEAAEVLV